MQFPVPQKAFAAEYKIFIYTSCCKLSWYCCCDISLWYCDITYHGKMHSYIFVK